MAGRPSKLSDESAGAICASIRQGVPKKHACRAAGVGYSTFFRWMDRAESDLDADAPYREFREQLEVAEAEFLQDMAAQVHLAATGWEELMTEELDGPQGASSKRRTTRRFSDQAARWMLERRFPEHFGQRQLLEHTGEVRVKRVAVPGLPAAEAAE